MISSQAEGAHPESNKETSNLQKSAQARISATKARTTRGLLTTIWSSHNQTRMIRFVEPAQQGRSSQSMNYWGEYPLVAEVLEFNLHKREVELRLESGREPPPKVSRSCRWGTASSPRTIKVVVDLIY
jgi:hypothetical protein